MASPTEEFFDELGRHRYEPLLREISGTVRIELVDGVCTEHWYLDINQGNIDISRDNSEADAAFRAERGLFDRAVVGEENLTVALLRGAATVEGHLELVVELERLLPGPPSSMARRRAVGTRP